MRRSGLTYANVASTAALVLAACGGAWAAVTGQGAPTQVVRACVKADGTLRVRHAGGHCHHGEKSLAWNVAGRAGPAGASGAAGARGPTGQTGAPGPAGSIVSAPAGGDLTGSYPDPLLAPGAVGSGDIAAVLLDGAPNAATLRSLGTGSAQAAAGNDQRLSDARTPTGTAGGSLSGTYPAPGIAGNAVGASQLADGSVTAAKLADGSVSSAKVADGSLRLSDFAVWRYDGTEPASSIAAGQCFGPDVSGTGVPVAPGDLLLGWIDDTLPFVAFSSVIVTQANSAHIRFCNHGSSTEAHPALNFTVIAIRP